MIPHENWFDENALAQIGLAGLPGLPGAPISSYDYELRSRASLDYHNRLSGLSHRPSSASGNSLDYASLYQSLELDGLHNLGRGSSTRSPVLDNRGFSGLGSNLAHTPPSGGSPLSTVSSAGSSHGLSGSTQSFHPGTFEHRPSYGGRNDDYTSLYGDSSNLKVSFDSLHPMSPTSSLLAPPALAPREGAGLLGTGPKNALSLQTSVEKLRREKSASIAGSVTMDDEENEEDQLPDEEVDELASDGEDEKSVEPEAPVANRSPESPVSVTMEDNEYPDSDVAVHKPTHALYPLLHQNGDPKYKLPALDLGHKGHRSTGSGSISSQSSSIYPDLGSLPLTSPGSSSGSSSTTFRAGSESSQSSESPSLIRRESATGTVLPYISSIGVRARTGASLVPLP